MKMDKDQLKRHIHKSDLTAIEKRYLEGLVDAQNKTDGRRLIDADAYKQILEDWLASVPCSFDDATNAEGNTLYDCICQLDKAPTIEAEPVKHGYWIGVQFDEFFECSVCGDLTDWKLYDYCPNCGAKMDGDRS